MSSFISRRDINHDEGKVMIEASLEEREREETRE
jgi:hypothetical protein